MARKKRKKERQAAEDGHKGKKVTQSGNKRPYSKRRKKTTMAVCNTIHKVPVLKDRDIKKVCGLIKDTSWVVAAVDHLRVIEKILQEKEIVEKEKSNESINNVISCLQTLDNCRLQLHEELEIQSIQGFVLKHNYMDFPNEIEALTRASVLCVRDEGEKYNKKLKNEASFMEADILRMRTEISETEVEIHDLLLNQKKIQEEESNAIEEFNIRLQKKLEIQEKLRNIRENIRDENQNIVLIETSILKMKDGLIREREKEKKELERYKSQIGGMLERKDEWKAKIDFIKPNYNEIMASLRSSDKSIEHIKTEVKSEDHKMNTSSRLRGTFQKKIKQELKARESFTERKKKNMECLTELTTGFEKELSLKLQNYNELETKIIFEESNHKELEVIEFENEKVLATFLEIEEDAREQWKEARDKLDSVQQMMFQYEHELFDFLETERNVEDTSDLLENSIEIQIEKMKNLIDTLIDMLNLKKKARIEIEELEETILKQLEEFKEERDIFETDTKKLIQKMEAAYVNTKEDIKLMQDSVKSIVSEIQTKMAEVQEMENHYEKECRKNESLIKNVESDADEFERMLNEYNTKLAILSHPDHQLAFENCLQEYSNLYSKQADDKSKLNRLISFVSRAEEEILIISKIKAEQESYMKILSEEYFQILKSSEQQMDEIEAEIYKQTCRLKFLKLENNILKQGIAESVEMIEEADKINQNEIILQRRLKRFLEYLKNGFINKEKEMEIIGEMALQRDTPFIGNYSDVSEVIRYNLSLISLILQQICQKTEKLNSTWPIIEKMKPVRGSAVQKSITKYSQFLTKPEM